VGELCFQDGQKAVFIGDSITDCGRRGENAPYGIGYVSLLLEWITAKYPERQITYVNKGIGGDRVVDLQARWQEDVTAERPDWLSVKVGINDLCRFIGAPEQYVSPELYRETYDAVLADAKANTSARLILIDPFYISNDTSGEGVESQVLQRLQAYIQTVHDMAEKYDARLVRTHDAFQRHLQHRPADHFCPEPVHPYRIGHMVIAHEVYKVLHQ